VLSGLFLQMIGVFQPSKGPDHGENFGVFQHFFLQQRHRDLLYRICCRIKEEEKFT